MITGFGVGFSANYLADFATVAKEMPKIQKNKGNIKIEDSTLSPCTIKSKGVFLYDVRGNILDWKFLLKFPVSLNNCLKWGLQ